MALYYYRARYYDPSIGRFTIEDPIAFAGGDANLYRYVGNSPLTYVDPFGMFTITYATMGRAALRAGNAVVGFAIGYACGYLEGWYRGDPDPHEQALNSAILGTAVGAALGATPAKFQLFVGIAGAVTAIGTSDDWVIAGIRTTCIAVQVGVAKGLRKLEQRWFPEGRWVPSGRSGGSYWEGPGVPPKPLAPRPFAPNNLVKGKSGIDLSGGGRYKKPQAWIDRIVDEDIANVRLSHRPRYNGRLRDYGQATLGRPGSGRTTIGRASLRSRNEMIDTIIHEETHHRLWARFLRGSKRAENLIDDIDIEEAYVDAVAKRFLRMKGVVSD